MVFFPNCNMELWEYTENETETNFWGETVPEYKYVDTIECDFQNLSPKDTDNDYGKTLEDGYKIYFPIDTPITDTMILRKEGEKDTYSIKGTPQVYDHFLKHIKVTVQKQRKPTKLIKS